jgi:hypothetical protein
VGWLLSKRAKRGGVRSRGNRPSGPGTLLAAVLERDLAQIHSAVMHARSLAVGSGVGGGVVISHSVRGGVSQM